jgi:N-carbamoylputrescine amidase
VAICWDQWFPESARAMALMGAEVLLYPSAIGSEPADPAWNSQPHWETVMRGHSGANLMPLVATNRIGTEPQGGRQVTFYGSSFIAGPTGELLAKASRDREEVVVATVDLDACAELRAGWGVFRDRRPEHYGRLAAL